MKKSVLERCTEEGIFEESQLSQYTIAPGIEHRMYTARKSWATHITKKGVVFFFFFLLNSTFNILFLLITNRAFFLQAQVPTQPPAAQPSAIGSSSRAYDPVRDTGGLQ